LCLFVSIVDPGDKKTKYCGPYGSWHSPNLPARNYFLYAIYMCVLCPGIELCHIFIEFSCYVYVVVLSCHGLATQLQLTNVSCLIILMTRYGHVAHLDLSVLFPGPASLLATYKRCVFFLAVFTSVVIQEINVISLEQTLMVAIRIQSFMVSFGLPDSTLAYFERQWR